jgi:hypothetical protein
MRAVLLHPSTWIVGLVVLALLLRGGAALLRARGKARAAASLDRIASVIVGVIERAFVVPHKDPALPGVWNLAAQREARRLAVEGLRDGAHREITRLDLSEADVGDAVERAVARQRRTSEPPCDHPPKAA